MKHTAIRLFLYAVIAMVPLACGSRKTQTDISKVKIEESTKVEEQTKVEEKEYGTTKEESKELITEYTENSKTTETKRYDAITGNLIEDSKVTEKGTAKKDSEKTASKTITYERYITHNIYRNIDVHRTIDSKDKSKSTDTSNAPLYWAIFGIGTIAVLSFGAYKMITRA